MTPTPIGVVAAINRFPVKSMQAETLAAAEVGWTGLAGDRQYAFVRAANRSRFPWLTGREVPDLVLHRAHYANPDDPRNAALAITSPDGTESTIDDPALLARLAASAGEPVHPIQVGRGCFDAMPVSVVSTATFDALNAARGAAVAPGRFRINLVIRPDHPTQRESTWLGAALLFGDGPHAVRVDLGWPIPRCAMVTVDPATAQRDPSVQRLVAQSFGNEIGAYGAVGRPGTIRVGDRVSLASPPG